MQNGDLATWRTDRWVVVIEGVLADVWQTEKKRRGLDRFRAAEWETQFQLHELPLKRLAWIEREYGDMASLDLVTFISEEFAEMVAERLNALGVSYDSLSYHRFETFCESLRFDPDVNRVYDSVPHRLQHYGQRGTAVVKGQDF